MRFEIGCNWFVVPPDSDERKGKDKSLKLKESEKDVARLSLCRALTAVSAKGIHTTFANQRKISPYLRDSSR